MENFTSDTSGPRIIITPSHRSECDLTCAVKTAILHIETTHSQHRPKYTHRHIQTELSCTESKAFFFFLNQRLMPFHTFDAHRPSWERQIRLGVDAEG